MHLLSFHKSGGHPSHSDLLTTGLEADRLVGCSWVVPYSLKSLQQSGSHQSYYLNLVQELGHFHKTWHLGY